MPPGSDATGPAPARPPAYQRHQYLAIALVVLGIVLYYRHGAALGLPGDFGAVDKLSGVVVFNEWIWLAAVVTGFHLVFGVAGRFAFSTAAFVGVGAYTSHYVTRTSGVHWAVGLAAAVGVALVIALAFAVLVRRAQHFYFAVATLGLAEVLTLVMRRWERLTGRSSGEITGAVDMTILSEEVGRREQVYVLVAFLALVLAIAALIQRSPLERVAVAARDNPAVAETLGIDTGRVGIVLFTLGSVIAAAAGSLFVHTRGIGTPDTFGLELGIGVFVALILGGLHSMWGGLIGAWFYVYTPLYLERWERWTLVIWGAVLVGVMIAAPEGLVGLAARGRAALAGRVAPRRPAWWAPLAGRLGSAGAAEPGGPPGDAADDPGDEPRGAPAAGEAGP